MQLVIQNGVWYGFEEIHKQAYAAGCISERVQEMWYQLSRFRYINDEELSGHIE